MWPPRSLRSLRTRRARKKSKGSKKKKKKKNEAKGEAMIGEYQNFEQEPFTIERQDEETLVFDGHMELKEKDGAWQDEDGTVKLTKDGMKITMVVHDDDDDTDMTQILVPKGYQEPTSYAISINKSAGEVEHFEKHEGVRFLNYVPKSGPGFEGVDKWMAALVRDTNPLYRWCRTLAGKKICICAKGKRQGLLRMIHSYVESYFKGEVGKFVFVKPPEADDACSAEAMEAALDEAFEEHGHFNAVVVSLKANHHNLAVDTLEAMDALRKKKRNSPVIVMETASKKYHKKHKKMVLAKGAGGYVNSLLSLFEEISRVVDMPQMPTDVEESLGADGDCLVM